VSTGQILQINISAGGVPKLPIQTAHVTRLGIEGDKHLYRLHGGPKKALMLMSAEFINTLAAEGYSVYYGAMGENLTVHGLPCADWHPGQRYRVGTALIEFTEPRAPCSKLRPYGPGIEKRIRRAPGESGFYAAVLEHGIIQPGDTIQLVDPVVAYASRHKFDRSISD
jgi:MOSC domain-containing protein YiiM